MGQASQAHIQHLAHAGIATHIIADQAGVDPVFAMAKARDMPDVHFAALFDRETLVLGCPDGLPDDLASLAQPIDLATADSPADPAPEGELGSATHKKIALLADRIASHMPVVEGGGPQTKIDLADLQEALINAVNAKLAEFDPTPGLAQLLELQIALQNTLDQAGPATPPSDDALATTMTTILDQSQARHDTLLSRLTSLQDAMQQPLSPSADIPDLALTLADTQRSLAEQAQAQHETLVQQTAEIKSALRDGGPTTANTDLEELKSVLLAIQNDLATLTSRPSPMLDLTAQRKSFASFGTALAGTLLRFEALADRIDGAAGKDGPEDTDMPTPPAEKVAEVIDDTVMSDDPASDDVAELQDDAEDALVIAEEDETPEDIAAADTPMAADAMDLSADPLGDLASAPDTPVLEDSAAADASQDGDEAEHAMASSAEDTPDQTPSPSPALDEDMMNDADHPVPAPAEADHTQENSAVTAAYETDEAEEEVSAEDLPSTTPSEDETIATDTPDTIVAVAESQGDASADLPTEDAQAPTAPVSDTIDPSEAAPELADTLSADTADPTPQKTTVQGLAPDDRLLGAQPGGATADQHPPSQPQITLDDLRSLFAELIATQMKGTAAATPSPEQAPQIDAKAS